MAKGHNLTWSTDSVYDRFLLLVKSSVWKELVIKKFSLEEFGRKEACADDGHYKLPYGEVGGNSKLIFLKGHAKGFFEILPDALSTVVLDCLRMRKEHNCQDNCNDVCSNKEDCTKSPDRLNCLRVLAVVTKQYNASNVGKHDRNGG